MYPKLVQPSFGSGFLDESMQWSSKLFGQVIFKFVSIDLQTMPSCYGLAQMLQNRILLISFFGSAQEYRQCYILPELVCGPSVLNDSNMECLRCALESLIQSHPFITNQVLFGLHELYPIDPESMDAFYVAWLCGALQGYFDNLDILAHLKARILQIGLSLLSVSANVFGKNFLTLLESCRCLDTMPLDNTKLGVEAVISLESFESDRRGQYLLPLYWRLQLDEVVPRSRHVPTPYCRLAIYDAQNDATRHLKFDMVTTNDKDLLTSCSAPNPADWWLYSTWSFFKRLVDSNCAVELQERKLVFGPEVCASTKNKIMKHLVFELQHASFHIDDLPTLRQLELETLVSKSTFVGHCPPVGVQGCIGVQGPTGS